MRETDSERHVTCRVGQGNATRAVEHVLKKEWPIAIDRRLSRLQQTRGQPGGGIARMRAT